MAADLRHPRTPTTPAVAEDPGDKAPGTPARSRQPLPNGWPPHPTDRPDRGPVTCGLKPISRSETSGSGDCLRGAKPEGRTAATEPRPNRDRTRAASRRGCQPVAPQTGAVAGELEVVMLMLRRVLAGLGGLVLSLVGLVAFAPLASASRRRTPLPLGW